MMARQMGQDCRENVANATLGHLFSRRGVLRRVSIPSWARRAVFFRDRGLCVICASDLSGVLAIGSEENYDHIVPLASGGLNDVTNIQLLCRRCNAKKLAGDAATTSRYEAWYPDHE
jgi:5-methylcytosine-specific restriction endonuclease McrA